MHGMRSSDFMDFLKNIGDEGAHVVIPVSEDAVIGDVLFVGSRDLVSRGGEGDGVRIGAVVQINSVPSWDPIHGFVADVTSLLLPEISVPLEIKIADQTQFPVTSKLSAGALEEVAKSFHDHLSDDQNKERRAVARELFRVLRTA